MAEKKRLAEGMSEPGPQEKYLAEEEPSSGQESDSEELGRDLGKLQLSSPFTPMSSTHIYKAPAKKAIKQTAARLPMVEAPQIEGQLKTFIKEFQRWGRLTGVDQEEDSIHMDWVVSLSKGKHKELLARVAEASQTM